MFGMQQRVCQNFSDTLRPCPSSVLTTCSRARSCEWSSEAITIRACRKVLHDQPRTRSMGKITFCKLRKSERQCAQQVSDQEVLLCWLPHSPLETHLSLFILQDFSVASAVSCSALGVSPPMALETPCKEQNKMKLEDQNCLRSFSPEEGGTQMPSSQKQWCPFGRKKTERIVFGKFPNSTTFVIWKMNFKSEYCSSSSFPTEATVWINEIDSARNMDELEQCNSLSWDEWFQTSKYLIQKLRVFSRSYWPRVSRGESSWKIKRQNRTIDSWKEDKIACMNRWLLQDHWTRRSSSWLPRLFSPHEDCQRARRHPVGRSTSLHDRSSRWRHIGKCVPQTHPVPRGIETSYGIVSAGYSAEKEPASYSRLKLMVRWNVQQNMRDKNFDARNEDVSLHKIKEDLEKSSRQWTRNKQRLKKWRLYSVDLERPAFARRFVQVPARVNTQREEGKEEDPVLLPTREDTLKETEKEIPKGKDPKVPIRQASRCANLFNRSSARRNPHAIVGTHQNAHTTNAKVDANGDICLCVLAHRQSRWRQQLLP